MSEGIKPAAYMQQTGSGEYLGVSRNICTSVNIPLYTKEQLQPQTRVKMTQAELDEWKELYYHLVEFSFSVHNMLDEILDSIGEERGKYTKLALRVYSDSDFMETSKRQAELVDLFVNYNPDKPEETIEVITDKKWFVRSKSEVLVKHLQFDTEEYTYSYLTNNIVQNTSYEPLLKDELEKAINFDTKEQAELWTNPLTEAVLLPVGDE